MVIYDDLSDLGDIYSVYYNFQSVIEYTAVYVYDNWNNAKTNNSFKNYFSCAKIRILTNYFSRAKIRILTSYPNLGLTTLHWYK